MTVYTDQMVSYDDRLAVAIDIDRCGRKIHRYLSAAGTPREVVIEIMDEMVALGSRVTALGEPT